ncbi:NADH dehydrogenase [ubiquinone] 1 alpha subcomplex subunit 11 [Mugil cephalus]|uniref:NADH dehydrogenase [ubiquinone] 1 alpha subcomplex subunit 11 n=1 Tax=Mugil cephalus TaxID=48193 RepID=UPI001FB5929B|nr:NADH dehydrogenase [ubiquinone] 1 alpha subcomplex subunit 11 [Mugil cephalus]
MKQKKKISSREISSGVLVQAEMGFWDDTEGTSCVEKTWISTKMGTVLGLVGSAYYIAAYQPDTALLALQKATNTTVTLASMGAIFGMATCISAQVREAPDEPLNYFIGGCSSGIFLGARTHSAMTGTSACLCLGTLAFFTKVAKMEGWRISGPKL